VKCGGEMCPRGRKASKAVYNSKNLLARLHVLGLKVYQLTISKIEQETRPVFDFEIVALAKALGVSTSWLPEEADN
jgi:hypothetical protein